MTAVQPDVDRAKDMTKTMSPPPAQRRNPVRIIGAALAVFVGVAIVGIAFMSVSGGGSVVVAANTIAQGAVITSDDLTVVDGNVDEVAAAAVAGSEMDALLGQTAIVQIAAGSVLNPDSLTSEMVPGAGMAVVGLALEPGQVPVAMLVPGDPVRVVSTVGPNAEPAAEAPPAVEATVHQIDYTDPSLILVDVIVPVDQEGILASRASTGNVTVVLGSVVG